jgi:hypothetical protein
MWNMKENVQIKYSISGEKRKILFYDGSLKKPCEQKMKRNIKLCSMLHPRLLHLTKRKKSFDRINKKQIPLHIFSTKFSPFWMCSSMESFFHLFIVCTQFSLICFRRSAMTFSIFHLSLFPTLPLQLSTFHIAHS